MIDFNTVFDVSERSPMVCPGRDGAVKVLKTEEEEGVSGTLRSVQCSPCGRYLAAGGDSKCVLLYDVNKWNLLHRLYVSFYVYIGKIKSSQDACAPD